MRYCVNGRQPFSVIKKADEIKFSYNDKDRIFDLIDDYADKTIILDVPGQESDWNNWKLYNEKFKEFFIALHDLRRADEFNAAGIKWYWAYPITAFYEYKIISVFNPSYVVIGPPLSFDLIKIMNDIPVRMVANVARPAYLPDDGSDGICGQWVRPEDVHVYEPVVQCLEFDECANLKEEETLLHIYQEQKTWPGNLNLLIKRLNYNVDNRALDSELAAARIKCGQSCMSRGTCHLCESAFKFADALRKRHYDDIKKVNIDNN